MKVFILFFTMLLSVCSLSAQEPSAIKDLAILTEARIDTISGTVTLSWIGDTNTYKYFIYKKKPSDSLFGDFYKELAPNVTEFTEKIARGESVEYMVERDAWKYWAYGYVIAGYDLKPVHNRGRVLILCDDSVITSISEELQILLNDLSEDGWIPHIKSAPRSENFDSKKVQQTKKIINDFYSQFKDLKTVILIGRIAVPYSGDFAVDGHPDHTGAWPTDVYYFINSGEWTDTISTTFASDPRNHNFKNDGKFDQLLIPSDVIFESGRIDMYKLPAFAESEIELLRRYLVKNHKYRNAEIKTTDSAIINDSFGLDYSEAFAASGWSNFSPIVGRNYISEQNLRYVTRNTSYLMAYGSAAGSYNSIALTLYTEDLAIFPYNVAFSMIFGSYNGDWDSQDNLLRAVLASEPFGLTVAWSGRPFWYFHHLTTGLNIGYSAKLSQNSYPHIYKSAGTYGRRSNHIELLGDPTLRLHYFKGVDTVIAVNENNILNISWSKSNDTDITGYYIYRANEFYGNYELLNQNPVTDLNYIDVAPVAGMNYYMVRTVKLQNTASGSYNNLSTGKKSNPVFFPLLSGNDLVSIFPVPAKDKLTIIVQLHSSFPLDIKIYDLEGNIIKTTVAGNSTILSNHAEIQLTDEEGSPLPAGIYFINVSNSSLNILKKIVKM